MAMREPAPETSPRVSGRHALVREVQPSLRWSANSEWRPPITEMVPRPMSIDINLPTNCGPVEVRVNGKVIAEVSPVLMNSRDDLIAEVTRARASLAACRWFFSQVLPAFEKLPDGDHVNTTAKKARERFAEGLRDGLASVTVPHPQEGVPDMLRDHSKSYEQGHHLGTGIRRACQIATGDMVIERGTADPT